MSTLTVSQLTKTDAQVSTSNSNNLTHTNNHTSCPSNLNQPDQLYINLNTFWYCFLALITSVGLIVSLISNAIVIYLISRTPTLRRNPSNIIAANLSLSDLLYCLQWPSVIYCSVTQSTWILEHKLVCQTFGFITVSTAFASILTILSLSVERALVICYSMHAKKRFTIKAAWLVIAVIWIISVSTCIPPLFGKVNRYALDPSKTSCTLDYVSGRTSYKLYMLILFFIYWLFPTLIIVISYILIMVTFRKSSSSLKEVSDSSEHQEAKCSLSLELTSTIFKPAPRKQSKTSMRLNTILDNSGFATLSNQSELTGSFNGGELFNNQPNRQHQRVPPPTTASPSNVRRLSVSVIDFDNQPLSRETFNGFKIRPFEPMTSTFMQPRNSEPADTLESRRSQLYLNKSSGNSNNSKCSTDAVARKFSQILRASLRVQRLPNIPKRRKTFEELYTDKGRLANINKLGHGRIIIGRNISNSTTSQQRTLLQFRLWFSLFYLIVLWFLAWTPIAVLVFLNSVLECHRANAIFVFVANTMTKLGPAFDVFVYGISHPKIKSKFKTIIKRFFVCH